MRWCALEIGRDCTDVTVMLRDFRSVPEDGVIGGQLVDS